MENGKKKQWLLIGLCWLVYMLAYLARYSFNANITSMMADYGQNRTEVGLISSFFFFAYGVGQVLNGIFCKHYNRRIVLTIALVGSFSSNLLIFLGVPFDLLKFVWMLNGVSQSFLWTSIILTLGQNLDENMLPKATFLMSSTAAIGTLLAYGLSAVYNAIDFYKLAFLTGAIGMGLSAILWFFFFSKLTAVTEKTQTVVENRNQTRKKIAPTVLSVIVMLAIFAIVNNFVKDGITGWSPDVLKSNFGFDDSISILITLILPIIGFVFQLLNVLVQKKIKNFVLLTGCWFALSVVTLSIAVSLLNTDEWGLFVVMMAFTVGFMYNINNTITSMAPLYMRDSINSGLMAGLMDGFCYIGSTISMVGLGALGDNFGWSGAFVVLVSLCLIAVVLTLVYLLISVIAKNRARKMENSQNNK